jgi:glutamine synthetase
MVDMQGRLIGKRFQAEFFARRRHRRDAWLQLPAGRRHRHGAGARLRRRRAGSKGYGDFVHEARPRHAAPEMPWLEGTALVSATCQDHHHHEPAAQPARHAQTQLARLDRGG